MFLLKEFKFSNLIVIELYFILISIKASFAQEFIDMKKLSLYNSSYFAIFDTGLYLYDFNALNFSLIHKFNTNEYKNSNNKINITELYYEYKAYIFCLVNEYLFIFSEYTYKLIYNKIEEIKTFDGYYNIMPYKMENNNLNFFMVFNKDTSNLLFYYYNFNFDGDINKLNEIKFDDMNIQNKKVRCDLNYNSTFIICFYYSKDNEQNYLVSEIFYIKDMNLEKGNISHFNVLNKINQIKFAKSYNDRFFVCFSNISVPVCLINNDSYVFNKINCTIRSNYSSRYKVLYFKESDDFMLISIGYCTTTILNNYNDFIKVCAKRMYDQQSNAYYINYNNGYNLINYTNLSEFIKYKDMSILEKNKKSNYLEQIKYSIGNLQNNEEIISILNEFLNNKSSTNYLDENDELIVHKDDMKIAFTSTYIQKKNENLNLTTINLGRCEKVLKNIYNITDESYLYMLKFDIEQKGKKYPIIEYEILYPLNNGEMEILNISFCKGINIEISIPFIINDTLDKYNPKSKYYNDICTKATTRYNTDITLNDRRNEFIKNNMSLCEPNCEFTDYDYNMKKTKCSCKVKTKLSLDNIELDGKNLMKNFFDIKKITNIEVVKCYKTVFTKNNMKNNYGSFIIMFIFILYFLCLIIFYCKSWENLIEEIIKIIKAKTKENNTNKIKQNYFFKSHITIKRRNIKIKDEKINSSFEKIKRQKNVMNCKRNKNNNINKTLEIYKKDKKTINILDYTDTELNSLAYKVALKKDKRTYIQYYCSLLKKNQSILFSFYPNKDYNVKIIKAFLFFFFYASDITVNALFFTDDTMHKIYVDTGVFNLNYQLPQIIYSFLISNAINFIIEYLSLSDDAINSIKGKKTINLSANKKIINCIQIKILFFFITTFILLLVFWYYISCFCAVYENTQILLIKDSLISFGLSLIYPFFINLIPGLFRISALKAKKGDKECLYKFSNILAIF